MDYVAAMRNLIDKQNEGRVDKEQCLEEMNKIIDEKCDLPPLKELPPIWKRSFNV